MITIDRRRFLFLASAPFLLVARQQRECITIEVDGASTFFAPHLESLLVPGAQLQRTRRSNTTYLTFQGLPVAKLPPSLSLCQESKSFRVASITRDENHRMRLHVRIGRS